MEKDTPIIKACGYMTSCHGAAYLHILCSFPYHYYLPRLGKRGLTTLMQPKWKIYKNRSILNFNHFSDLKE